MNKRAKKKKILYLVTEDWYFCSHRLPLAVAAREAGYDVVVATRVQAHADEIRRTGARLIAIRMRRRRQGWWHELCSLLEIMRIYYRERPDIVHHVALKPVVFGSLATWLIAVPQVVNAVAGLGYVFTSRDRQARCLRPVLQQLLRRLLVGKGRHVIVQNPQDQQLLQTLAEDMRLHLIRGAGVDIEHFSPSARSGVGQVALVVLPARMLWDKGVAEFVAAARLLQEKGIAVRMALVGGTDDGNPAAISQQQLTAWQQEGIVEYWGRREDMVAVYRQADIVCLPSYREGLPKVLLEAAACACAMVATDVPGCREVVRQGETGLLVPARAPTELAEALTELLADPLRRQQMGAQARVLVCHEFSARRVNAETLLLYRQGGGGK